MIQVSLIRLSSRSQSGSFRPAQLLKHLRYQTHETIEFRDAIATGLARRSNSEWQEPFYLRPIGVEGVRISDRGYHQELMRCEPSQRSGSLLWVRGGNGNLDRID